MRRRLKWLSSQAWTLATCPGRPGPSCSGSACPRTRLAVLHRDRRVPSDLFGFGGRFRRRCVTFVPLAADHCSKVDDYPGRDHLGQQDHGHADGAVALLVGDDRFGEERGREHAKAGVAERCSQAGWGGERFEVSQTAVRLIGEAGVELFVDGCSAGAGSAGDDDEFGAGGPVSPLVEPVDLASLPDCLE